MSLRVLFASGTVVATPGALRLLTPAACVFLVLRHQSGEWGDLDDEDKRANERALLTGERILSAYVVTGVRVLVITEHDRSLTTCLLASEY